jgi:hypothetical protein
MMLNADPPNISLALETVRRMLRDAKRASDIVARLQAMFSNQKSEYEYVISTQRCRKSERNEPDGARFCFSSPLPKA